MNREKYFYELGIDNLISFLTDTLEEDQKEYIVRITHNLWLEENEFYDDDVLRLMIITEAPKGYEDSKIKLYVGGVFRSLIYAVQIE